MAVGPTLLAGVAYPGEIPIPATWAAPPSNGDVVDAVAVVGAVTGAAVPPATDAIASGVADSLGGAG